MREWKSLDCQLNTLESLGMNVGDRAKAKDVLQRVGFFRFGGYSAQFRIRGKNGQLREQFLEGTRLSEIYDLYVFDKKLKHLCLDAIERIEIAIRTAISQELGQIDPMAHMELSNFDPVVANRRTPNDDRTEFKKWHDKHRSFIDWKKKSKGGSFVKQYLNNKDQLPIWVAAETFDFGSLSHLLMMMKKEQRNNIASKYKLNHGESLSNWILCIAKIRNICAHHERLWNAKIPRAATYVSAAHVSSDISDDDIKNSIKDDINNIRTASNERVFHYLCIMQFLLTKIYPGTRWGMRIRDHLLSFPTPKNEGVTIKRLGVAKGWEAWTLWGLKDMSSQPETTSHAEKLAHWLQLRKSA